MNSDFIEIFEKTQHSSTLLQKGFLCYVDYKIPFIGISLRKNRSDIADKSCGNGQHRPNHLLLNVQHSRPAQLMYPVPAHIFLVPHPVCSLCANRSANSRGLFFQRRHCLLCKWTQKSAYQWQSRQYNIKFAWYVLFFLIIYVAILIFNRNRKSCVVHFSAVVPQCILDKRIERYSQTMRYVLID